MENYKITKYQIEKLADENSIVKDCLKEWFPSAFKTELVVGKWYIASCCKTNEYLILATEIIGNNEVRSNCWFTPAKSFTDTMGLFDKVERLATPEEVEAALKYQAQKLGFKDGVRFISLFSNGTNCRFNPVVEITEDEFLFQDNTLLTISGYRIFANGKWAQILPQEKTVVPMEKALKIIAKKMKVSPENIEIKN